MGLLLLMSWIAIYCLPIVVSGSRKTKNFAAICIVNLLLGWTFVAWVGCLAWAAVDKVKEVY